MSPIENYLKKCRICGSEKLFKFLDLGQMPIPNGFLKKEDLDKPEHKFELSTLFCENCGLVQLSNIVNPNLMFKNYVYVPSVSYMMMENFRELSKNVSDKFKLNSNSFVIDVGSNDGSLLTYFKELGVKVLGIDPAENLSKIAELKGIKTEIKFFNLKNAKAVVKKYGRADVVTATNVVAHVNDLNDFFKALSIILKNDGIFVSEFPYLAELIKGNEFDTIYHEHLSYFSLRPWKILTERYGFEILGIEELQIHGGSIRIFHRKKTAENKSQNKLVDKFIASEKKEGFHSTQNYLTFSKKVDRLKVNLIQLLSDLKARKKSIVGYGAAAKGNVLMNYFKIGPDILDYIVDSTPYKQGLYTPGSHIPVFGEVRLKQDKPDYVLILAWNFAKEIMDKEKDYKHSGGRFIIPIPKLKII